MPPPNPPHYANLRPRLLRDLLRTPAPAVLLHWLFQSLLYMDPTERRFKLALDILLAAPLALLLVSSKRSPSPSPPLPSVARPRVRPNPPLPSGEGLEVRVRSPLPLVVRPVVRSYSPLLLSLLLAHTLNFLFNAHLWGVLKHYRLVRTPAPAFHRYLQGLILRARRQPSIRGLYVYGSLARGEASPSSDLDARLLRRPGFINGLRACTFALTERTRALFARFPLDLYVLDSPLSLQKMCPGETPIDLFAGERSGAPLPP